MTEFDLLVAKRRQTAAEAKALVRATRRAIADSKAHLLRLKIGGLDPLLAQSEQAIQEAVRLMDKLRVIQGQH